MNIPVKDEVKKNIHIKIEKWFQEKYPAFHDYLLKKYPDKKHIERLYLYYNNDKSGICPTCKKPTKFRNFNLGYYKYCSSACVSKNDTIKQRKIETCLKNYGVDNPSKSNIIQQCKIKTNNEKFGENWYVDRTKAIQTMIEKYGVKYPMQCEDIKNKLEYNNLKKYGVKYPLQLKSTQKKSRQTKLKLYGNEYYNNPEKMKSTCLERYGKEYYNNWERAKQTRIERYGENTYKRHIQPIDTSIETYIKKLLDEHNIAYIPGNRTILNGLELDVYIPDKKIGIECNGCYWHSDKYKDKKYHYNKRKLCDNLGIQLITIWEDQIMTKPKIVSSLILSKLGIYKERIYARKCYIKEITSLESSKFLNDNHLQGNIHSKIRYGLFYKNELVSVMTFGSSRRCTNSQDKTWELYRYCCKLNTQVVGGASKLFMHFIKNIHPNKIISFSSNDISEGKLYKMLNFTFETSSISYWYIKNNIRYHRYNFTKSKLVGMGYDEKKTEFQIMDELKYYRIFDSGQSKWVWFEI